MKYGSLNFLEPSGPVLACNGAVSSAFLSCTEEVIDLLPLLVSMCGRICVKKVTT